MACSFKEFNSLHKSFSFSNTFEFQNQEYHYSNCSLIECQMLRIISLFLNTIGVKSVQYDYDEDSCITYCKSMVQNNEKLIEFPVDLGSGDYTLSNVYFSIKNDIKKYKNYEVLLKDLCNAYFIAALFDDSDKNIGYIVNNGQISLTPYYDLGSFFSVISAYGYRDYLPDTYIDEKEMKKFCLDNGYNEDYIMKDYEKYLNKYLELLNANIFFAEDVLSDCLPNISDSLMENILNIDIGSLIDSDYHIYSDNSKKAIISIFNNRLDMIKNMLKNYQNSK